ncbi:MAG: porin [Leucothrix sp.]
MKKIIILSIFSCLATSQVVADVGSSSVSNSGLKLGDSSTLELLGEYDIGYSLKGRYQVDGAKYDFLGNPSAESDRKVWIGVAGDFGEVRAGYHDSLDALATMDADQHKASGAYDLIMRGDSEVKRSITYMQQSGSVGLAAQYGTGSAEDDDSSMGVLLNTQQGPYEAAIAYQRTPKKQGTLKGRVTYKSRNNSKIRLDLVAEKFDVGEVSTDTVKSNSMSFMVGAKYKLTPKAYVVGQYGIIGFDNKSSELAGDVLSLDRDYKALSLEAGYSLSDSTSVFISHSQKNYDSSSLVAPLFGSDEASQTNSIGVRLNW